MQRLIALLVTIALFAGLTGCSFLDRRVPEPQDLSCLWVNDEDGSSFELGGYGDFTYWNRPGSVGNEGTWIYGNGVELRGSSSSGYWQITLNFTEPRAEHWRLYVSGSGDNMTLFEFKGDPDRADSVYEFRRAECD